MKTNEREITMKETSTASLLSRLRELQSHPQQKITSRLEADFLEAESIEQELEERNEWESKVSRW